MTDTPPAEPRPSDNGDDHPGDNHLRDPEGESPQPTAVSATPVPQPADGSPNADGSPESEGALTGGGNGNGDIDTAGSAGRRGRARMVALLATVVAIGLIATTLVGGQVLGWWGSTGTPAAEPSPSPSPTQMVDPFAGTPAEDFPEGADGIVLPEAEPVGDFTAEEVADALEQVREALIAARLDHTMLIDHNPEPFLSLLALDQQLRAEEQFESGEFAFFASQFSEDSELLARPRVAGDITFRVASPGGAELIEISTRFLWSYAIGTMADKVQQGVVVVHDELVWTVRGNRWEASSQGLWLSGVAFATWAADCSVHEDGLIKPSQDRQVTDDYDTEAFSLEASVGDQGDC